MEEGLYRVINTIFAFLLWTISDERGGRVGYIVWSILLVVLILALIKVWNDD
jgi:hypothetical protein